jgi:4-aminobutyrate aminotransferase-like enzyme
MMPDAYQNKLTEEEMTAKASAEYANLLSDPANAPAAFIVESVMCCGGMILLPDGYLQKMTALTRASGGLTIADEVQTGFGRSGSDFWAFEAHGVVPDIVTMGKPFGNGFPLAAVVTSKAVADSANMLEYFNTFGGNPVACAVGLEVLSVIRDEGLQDNAVAVGGYALSQLRELQSAHPQRIGDVRGMGLLLGVEFVEDPETRTPDPLTAAYVMQRMKAQGVLVSTDGLHQHVVKMKPPMCVNESDVDALVAAMDCSLRELSMRRTSGFGAPGSGLRRM